MGICYILGAGECNKVDFIKEKNDFVICADGGLEYAEKFGITPDLVVGDFDSLGRKPELNQVIVLPKEKDDTDTHYAIKKGFEKGYTNFLLYGMLGGRIDHSLANIQLLVYILNHGGSAVLKGDEFDVTAVKNGKIMLNGNKGNYVSVFSHTPLSNGVGIHGLKYEVDDFVLFSDNPLGVSNEFTGSDATVEVKDGILIVTVQK